MKGYAGGHCPYLDQCVFTHMDSEDILAWLQEDFTRHYTTNRAPYTLALHTNWFTTEQQVSNRSLLCQQLRLCCEQRDALVEFLDWVQSKEAVYLVTATQALLWMTDPVPVSQLQDFQATNQSYNVHRIPQNLQWHVGVLPDTRTALCAGVGLPGGPARPTLLLPQQVLADPQRGRGGGGSLHDHLPALPRPLPLARQRARPGHRGQGRLREVLRLNKSLLGKWLNIFAECTIQHMRGNTTTLLSSA